MEKLNLKKSKHLMKSMGMGKVISVPIRKRGMTGSGKFGACHINVSKLAVIYPIHLQLS